MDSWPFALCMSSITVILEIRVNPPKQGLCSRVGYGLHFMLRMPCLTWASTLFEQLVGIIRVKC